MAEPGLLPIERVAAVPGQDHCTGQWLRPGMQRPSHHRLGTAGWKTRAATHQHPPFEPHNKRRRPPAQRKAAGPGERGLRFGGDTQGDPLRNGEGPETAGRRKKAGRHLPMEENLFLTI